MDHFPFQVITTCSPVVMVDSLVAVNRNEVLPGICCQLTVKVCGSDYCFFILGKALSRLFDDGEDFWHHFIKGFLIDIENVFLNLVDLSKDVCTLVDGRIFNGCLQFGNLCFLREC